MRAACASSASATGVTTAYDAIGRVSSVVQHSELGNLATSTVYSPSAFQATVTNPRGHATTTTFRGWDAPTTDFPVLIDHPEGAVTQIERDAFGKPKAIMRRNDAGTLSLTRQYVYDPAQQRLEGGEQHHVQGGPLAAPQRPQPLPQRRVDALGRHGHAVQRTHDQRVPDAGWDACVGVDVDEARAEVRRALARPRRFR